MRHIIQTDVSFIALLVLSLWASFVPVNRVEAQALDPRWSTPIDITQRSASATGSFGMLLCDQYQNTHVFWVEQGTKDSLLYHRDDAVGDWSEPRDILFFPGTMMLPVVALTDSNDTVHLIWLNRPISGDVYYSSSPLSRVDQPNAWSSPVLLAQNVDAATIYADSTGVLHLVYGAPDSEGFGHNISYMRLDDAGTAWSDPLPVISLRSPVPAASRPEIAVDTTGRIHVAVTINSQDYGKYSEVGYLQSTDSGLTWSTYRQIQTMGTTFQGVAWIVPFTFGAEEVHLTWHDPRRMHQWSTDGGLTWSAPTEIVSLGAGFGGRNELAKDAAGNLYAVTAVGEGVFVTQWAGDSWGPRQQLDDRYIDPHGQHLVVCQGNRLHVVYYDRIGVNTVWYSTRLVNAPELVRQPIPSAVAITPSQPTERPQGDVATVLPQPTASKPEGLPTTTDSAPKSIDPLQTVLISLAPVFLLILVTFAVRQRRRS